MNVPSLPARGGPLDLLRGVALGFAALRLIFTTPRLFVLAAICALVTAAALVGVGFGAWHLGDLAASWLVDGGSTWRSVAQVALRVALTVLFFAIGALTAPNLLLSPLQDPLSEATETRLGDFTPEPFSASGLVSGMLLSLRHTVVRLALMTLGSVLLLPLNLVPGAGSVLYLISSALWAMGWLAVEHLSNPMARHRYRFRAVLGAVWRRPFLALGFGALLWVLLWLPVLNCLLLPVAVVAGTLLYRALRSAGLLPMQA